MDIRAVTGQVKTYEADTLVTYLMEGSSGDLPGNATHDVNEALDGLVVELIESGEFTGKRGDITVLYTRGAILAKRVIVVGLGAAEEFSAEEARKAVARGMWKARELKARHVATVTLGTGRGSLDMKTSAQSVAEGALLSLYQYRGQKTGDIPEALPERLDVIVYEESHLDDVKMGVAQGIALAAGTSLARDLVNLPPNICTPEYLAKQAREMAKHSGLTVQVLEKKQMETLKMGALLGVAQGSDTPPRFIILEYNADKAKDLDTLVLVGKGVTFDTGGYSLKTRDGMVGMKADMAGGAAVIGAMGAIAALKPEVHVVGLVPAADNMVSGNAYRPQEVVTASNGKTIEIISTDAEGRLLLADALSYATRYKPAAVVDMATLTGSCVVALGGVMAGLFSLDEKVSDALVKAGKATHELVWPMPVNPEYGDSLKSETADTKNSGSRFGGASVAAVFLKNFVDYPWAHVDIAGVAGIDGMGGGASNPYIPTGATGFGVRLLATFVQQWAESNASKEEK